MPKRAWSKAVVIEIVVMRMHGDGSEIELVSAVV